MQLHVGYGIGQVEDDRRGQSRLRGRDECGVGRERHRRRSERLGLELDLALLPLLAPTRRLLLRPDRRRDSIDLGRSEVVELADA